jgi:hypothetical protein
LIKRDDFFVNRRPNQRDGMGAPTEYWP